jgi:acyl-coenzyme A thioesterase PaaI-like protein
MAARSGGGSQPEWHLNAYNQQYIHIAALSYALEVASAFAVATTCAPDEASVHVQSTTQSMRPALVKEHIVRGTVQRRGRTLTFVDSSVEDSEGTTISRSSATYAIVTSG